MSVRSLTTPQWCPAAKSEAAVHPVMTRCGLAPPQWRPAGVNVLALQRMLGHASAKMTLDTYADLFDTDLDAVAEALHARYSQSSVLKTCSRGT